MSERSRPPRPALGPAVLVALASLAVTAGPAPAGAQDAIGRAVAIVPGDDGRAEILVLKPVAGRGPAALLVFRQDERGVWRRTDRLPPHPASDPYEGFSPSIAVAGDVVAVAAADADAAWGAHLYRRSAAGGWIPAERVPLDPAAVARAPDRSLDMAMLMRIMQPPARAVAAGTSPGGGGGHVIALAGRVDGRPALRVLERDARPGGGAWRAADVVPAGGEAASAAFGTGLAVGDGWLAVGDPGRGRVHVHDRDAATGAWRHTATLTAAAAGSDAADARFGEALHAAGSEILIGAPGEGVVYPFARAGESVEWTAGVPLRSAHGSRFGSALAGSADEVWVAAVGEDDGRGAVHRFTRPAGGGAWQAAGMLPRRALPPGSGFGLGLALAGDLGVVAAPLAEGGRVAVYRRAGDGWAGPEWLETVASPAMVADGEVRCEAGTAAGFDCRAVDLLAFLPIAALGGARGEWVSDLWGWSDPETGREYALVGRSGGMAIVDVSDPASPRYVGVVPANLAGPRDIKVYADHAFFTGDGAGDHGLIVFDLRRLREGGERPRTFEPDARYGDIASAHNLVIETETGIAIPVGASGGGNTCGGGLHMIDVTTPLEPTFLGCFTDTEGLIWQGRTHDAQCVVYRGPDAAYRGRTLCFASNETALRIVDITDPSSPVPIARAAYPGIAYAHQGWLSEDQRHFYMNDELDEMVGLADRTRTLIWDIADLDDPVLAGEYFGPDGATDHNLYVRGDRMYQANYQAGFRLIDIADPVRPVEIGFFDTTPYGGNPAGFGTGAWTAYPFLPSGTVLVSSMREGLFLLRPRPPILP